MSRVLPSVDFRQPNFIRASLKPSDPGVTRFRVLAAKTIDDAYGADNDVGGSGPVALFTVDRNRTYISRSVQQRGNYVRGLASRGVSQALWDPDDFVPGSGVAPMDTEYGFYRAQEFHTATNDWLPMGPIRVVQPSQFYNIGAPILSLAGTAPTLATAAAGSVPPTGVMNIRLPTLATAISIQNLESGGGQSLFVSFGLGATMMEIGPGQSYSMSNAQAIEFFVAANSPVRWSANFTMQVYP